jgi:glycerophosphoryl diester phosphodiesterase
MEAPLLIAHRGVHDTEVENTLAAFEAAAQAGVGLIELDVRRSGDDQLVIFHDAEVAKTPVGQLTHERLCELSRRQVPRLEEVLGWAATRGVGLDVELKENGYVERVAPLLEAFATGGPPLIITSFIDPVIGRLADLVPGLRRGLIVSMTAMGALRRVRECRADAAVLEMKLVREPVLAELAEAGVEVLVWDFLPDRPGHADWLGDARISGFITDEVAATRARLTSAG